MSNPLFVKVKECVAQWLKDNEDKFKSKNIMVEIVTNTEECLYLTLNFGGCMAAIVVAEPDFAPYRFVSFEAMRIVNGISDLLHFWYDEEGTTIEEIIENLDKAIEFVLEQQ